MAAQPQATWLERKYDFGVFKEQDGKVTCQLRVVNTGTDSLIIVKAQAGCGCTAVTFPNEAILPGDTATVGMTYNPSGRLGQFTKQAIIFTNTVPNRTILEISGNVIPTSATLDKQYPVSAGNLHISKQIMPMGEITRGNSKSQYLSAYNASTDTLVVDVLGGNEHIHPAVVPDTVLPAQVTALTVHYLSGYAPQWGLNTDTLTLTCHPLRQHSPAAVDTAVVLVMAQVVESFSNLTDEQLAKAPVVGVDCGDRLDFGTVTPGQVETRTFTITNKGKNPLIIRRLWAPNGEGITAQARKSELKRGKSTTVTVKVDTSRQQGETLNVPLTLMTNDPTTPRLTIRLVGFIDNQ